MNRFAEGFMRNYHRVPLWVRYLLVPVWVLLAMPFAMLVVIALALFACALPWIDGSDEALAYPDDTLDAAGDQ